MLVTFSLGCGEDAGEAEDATSIVQSSPDDAVDWSLYRRCPATEVIEFAPSGEASFNHDQMPDIVLGLPRGGGENAGSLDVVSLGQGGSIILGFDDCTIVDGEGIDFTVFENPFAYGQDNASIFSESAEVGISDNGIDWVWFDCDPSSMQRGQSSSSSQCAGWEPGLMHAEDNPVLGRSMAGGDGFDIAELGMSQISYVQIRSLAAGGGASDGFDLDAVVGWFGQDAP